MAQESEERSAGTEPVRALLEEFFRRYLTRRDLAGTLELVDEGIISIGSGEGEVALDKTAFRQLLEEEFSTLEQPIRFSLTNFTQRQRVEGVWDCFCNMETIVTLPDGQQARYPMRVTAAVYRQTGGLRIQTLHASEASLYMEDGEFIPLKFLSRGVESLSRETRLDLLEIIGQIMPGGILGGYMEEGFPLYVANERMLRMMGYDSCEEFEQGINGCILNSIHPDDREYVNREMATIPNLGDQYEIQYRMQKKDGSYLWIHDIGRRTLSADGRDAVISVIIDITRQMQAQATLETEAVTDPLTGIYNRKGGRLRMEQQMQQAERYLFLMLDLDNFKQVNDLYGHEEGDRALCTVARLLQERFRKSDVVCRVGGDEFAVFAPGCGDEEPMRHKLDALIEEYRQTMLRHWPAARSTLSVGGVCGSRRRTFAELYQMADEVLYEVKRSQKGRHILRCLD
ncbi:diguanylate cyclase [Candidatus Avoscillospira sp. LCP25S3_F1]|uniref:diguanylate cyclase n=1 Tax=Candidatus Avoscillospira sp. LCP25S3_F1 TaxID=3438825 RepID=UPI003F8EAAED